MLFFKVEGTIANYSAEKEDNRRERKENARKTMIKSDAFNKRLGRRWFYFVSSIGGVLFIDEAYALVDGHSGSYGDEAINTIVQEMENHREEMVVIFAGYPDKMEAFLQKNPGLRSRIAFHVPFQDYNAKDLCQIAQLIGKRKGISFDAEATAKLETVFEAARKQSDFGNGRYARNLIEQAKMNQATRLLAYDFADITTEEITTIKAVDIVVPEIQKEGKRRIGFVC